MKKKVLGLILRIGAGLAAVVLMAVMLSHASDTADMDAAQKE